MSIPKSSRDTELDFETLNVRKEGPVLFAEISRYLIEKVRTSPRCQVIDTLLMRMRARPNPPSCWPCSW